jgi:hypothetical protein
MVDGNTQTERINQEISKILNQTNLNELVIKNKENLVSNIAENWANEIITKEKMKEECTNLSSSQNSFQKVNFA